MVKLTVNKKYQEFFDTLTRYQRALNNQKEKYLQLALKDGVGSTSQTDAFDAAFILDFMMTSNKQLIDYLYFLQKCNNSVMNQILDNAIDLLNKEESIPHLLESINDQINNDNELIHEQRNYYMLRSILLFIGGVMLVGGCITLVKLVPLGTAMIFVAVAATVVVASVMGIDATNSKEKYEAITQHSVSWPSKGKGNHDCTFSGHIKTEPADKKTISASTTLLSRTFSESKINLRANFFNKTYSSKSLTLASEVQKEYKML